jgi:hypothetical protein
MIVFDPNVVRMADLQRVLCPFKSIAFNLIGSAANIPVLSKRKVGRLFRPLPEADPDFITDKMIAENIVLMAVFDGDPISIVPNLIIGKCRAVTIASPDTISTLVQHITDHLVFTKSSLYRIGDGVRKVVLVNYIIITSSLTGVYKSFAPPTERSRLLNE